MEKFIILQFYENKQKSRDGYYAYGICKSNVHVKSSFIELVNLFYQENWTEGFKDYWNEKGASTGFDDGIDFMQDEPSGKIYCYDYFVAQKVYDAWWNNLSKEEVFWQLDHPDDGTFIVDFIREGKIPFYEKMHKNNLFEIYEIWDRCYQDPNINYMVWYEDANEWVHLEGFETEEQARDFVKIY